MIKWMWLINFSFNFENILFCENIRYNQDRKFQKFPLYLRSLINLILQSLIIYNHFFIMVLFDLVMDLKEQI